MNHPELYWLPSYISYEKAMAAKYGHPKIYKIEGEAEDPDKRWYWQCWCTIWGVMETWEDARARLELHTFSGEHVFKPQKP